MKIWGVFLALWRFAPRGGHDRESATSNEETEPLGSWKRRGNKHLSDVIKAALLIKEMSPIEVSLTDDNAQRSAHLCETFSYKWIGQTKGIIPT